MVEFALQAQTLVEGIDDALDVRCGGVVAGVERLSLVQPHSLTMFEVVSRAEVSRSQRYAD